MRSWCIEALSALDACVMTRRRSATGASAVIALVALGLGCGGSSPASPTSPTPTTGDAVADPRVAPVAAEGQFVTVDEATGARSVAVAADGSI